MLFLMAPLHVKPSEAAGPSKTPNAGVSVNDMISLTMLTTSSNPDLAVMSQLHATIWAITILSFVLIGI